LFGLVLFFVRLAASVIVMRDEHGYVRGFNTLMKILDGALPVFKYSFHHNTIACRLHTCMFRNLDIDVCAASTKSGVS